MTNSGNELMVLLNGKTIGCLRKAGREIEFQYVAEWLARSAPIPLSLSMPLREEPYVGDVIENWLWGLLPDNERTLRRWAQIEQVSPRDVFNLIEHFGEDVAGAVQFVRSDRLEHVQCDSEIRWLSNDDVVDRIRRLREDPAAGRLTDDPGRFSLAGAQAKTALLYKQGRWAVPSGKTPTNMIVKLAPSGHYADLVSNEHFCLELAARIGLPTAKTRVLRSSDTEAIVVERYDRKLQNGVIGRVHQEDMCQVLGIHPFQRYENEGGPGVRDVLHVLQHSSACAADMETFFRAQVFNFLIGGTDAHAKNFSILLGNDEEFRLAPLYDIASIYPYADTQRMKLAMRIGKTYRFDYTMPRHWLAMAEETQSVKEPLRILEELAETLPAAADGTAESCHDDGITDPAIRQIVTGIKVASEKMLKVLPCSAKSVG